MEVWNIFISYLQEKSGIHDHLYHLNVAIFFRIILTLFSNSPNSIAHSNVSGFFINTDNINNTLKKKKRNENNAHDNENKSENDDKDENISCILIGINGPFLQRLNALQVEPLMLTDKETMKVGDFRKFNIDKQSQGCTGIFKIFIIIIFITYIL